MSYQPWLSWVLIAVLGGVHAQGMEATADGIEFFENEIRPLLVARCYECHGPIENVKGGLSLVSRPGLLAGGESGPAAVPGKPAASLLVEAVRYQGVKMPPTAKLPQGEIEKLTRWVEMGLPWPDAPDTGLSAAPTEPRFAITDAQRQFWSFQTIRPQTPPAVQDSEWPLTAIDAFVLARLESGGLHPNPPADKRTIIRRATFDLVGLPPTPEDIETFTAEEGPVAFERVVDRLLASPRYGERWGRYWLDVVRYADTAGETADIPVPEAYKYRNYVIHAFNQDKPYDQFVREQIAGDILAGAGPRDRYAEQVTATGFLAISRRFGYDSENYHHLTIADTIDCVGRSMLGLSIGCARCHDHKYDPLSMSDYYALYGIFASSRYAFPGSEEKKLPRDFAPLAPPEESAPLIAAQAAELAHCNEELKRLGGEIDQLSKSIKQAEESAAKAAGNGPGGVVPEPLEALTARRQGLERELSQWRAKKDKLVLDGPCEMAYAVVEGTPQNAKIQKRGEPNRPGPEVPRRFLEILGADPLAPGTTGSGRLELAQWLTRRDNPLVARVIVNRVWQHHFGRGLVPTSSDFGLRGRAPTHPELLDYLADNFVRQGWSIKSLHRLIMMSRVYQMSASDDNEAAASDPANSLCWRFDRHRLDAEAIRDAVLDVSGQLDSAPGGPHPFPPKTTWTFSQHAPFKAVYPSRQRSVYLMTQRIARHPFLSLFDGADPNTSTAERLPTTTPAQALFLMNDPFIHEQSAALANRLMAERADDSHRVERAHWLLLGRPPTQDEINDADGFLDGYRRDSVAAGSAPAQAAAAAWSAYARVLLTSNEFLYIE